MYGKRCFSNTQGLFEASQTLSIIVCIDHRGLFFWRGIPNPDELAFDALCLDRICGTGKRERRWRSFVDGFYFPAETEDARRFAVQSGLKGYCKDNPQWTANY